ncbi:hypothetical protein FB45DRAFT_415968 [Roridomyces roridus]|uniref:Uncharacterized protein n=1 Tax=Roridomyces roridus TaxID=1738132 RepID=A0AAD7C4Q0_9AGAR|nr:hypothetical protein FB45DRAFT_415968 [Roridomyces roridus]
MLETLSLAKPQNFAEYTRAALQLLKTAALDVGTRPDMKPRIVAAVSQYFIHSCLSKITIRMRQVNKFYHLVENDSKRRFEDWNVAESEFAPVEVQINKARARKFLSDRKLYPIPGSSTFLITSVTATLWWKIVVSLVESLRKNLTKPSVVSISSIYAPSVVLHELLRVASPLWRSNSLNEHIKEFVQRSSKNAWGDIGAASAEDEEDVTRDALQSDAATESTDLGRFVRVMDTICAWTTAVHYILANKLSKKPLAIHLSHLETLFAQIETRCRDRSVVSE